MTSGADTTKHNIRLKRTKFFDYMKILIGLLRRIVILLIALVGGEAIASADNIRFERFSASAGLSQQTITSIFQDSRGYMWFGTQEGLNKYDGIKFTVYQPKYNDPHAMSSGWALSISEDNNGDIWIGTRDGVNVLDVNAGKFRSYSVSSGDSSINDMMARVVYKDQQGTMWVGTRKGLNQYISSEKRFKHYSFIGTPENPTVDVVAISEDITGALWLGSTRQGLMRFDTQTETLSNLTNQFPNIATDVQVSVRSLYIDEDQVLWIGTISHGFFKLDLQQPKTDNASSAISFVAEFDDKEIAAVAEDMQRTLWVGTNRGIYYKKFTDERFIFLQNRPNSASNLVDDDIRSLYSDASGVFWVGAFNGLNKWNSRTTQFDHFYENENSSQSLSNNKIGMIGSDTKNIVYIGSRAGVDMLNPDTNEVQSIPIESAGKPGLRADRVMSFAYVNDEEMWFGYSQSGATKYNSINNTYTHYSADRSGQTSLLRQGITSIIHASDGTVWFGTFGGGISRYNRQTDDFTSYVHNPDDISSLSDDKVITLYETKDGNLWVGTWDAGLNIFVPSSGAVFRIKRKENDPGSLGSNKVVSFLEDSDNNIWVGTHGGGLNLLTARNKAMGNITFEKLDSESGMPSNVAYGLLEDNQGYLWCSTNKGLVKIDRHTKEVFVYTVSQGIQGDEFNSGTHYKDPFGYLYFGGNNGVTRFKPENIQANPVAPKIVFTGFQRLNKIEKLADITNEKGEVEVFYQDYLIGFEFAALDYAAPADNEYLYKLEGFDKNWIEVRDSARATYTNLPSGSYEFKVKAANSDGVWNEQGNSITLVVNPPPWLSAWAYTFYCLTALALGCYVSLVLKRKSKQRQLYQAQLEYDVNIRTSELKTANEKLLEASITDQLSGLHNRRYLADVIEGRLESIRHRFAQNILDDVMTAYSGPRLMALMFDLDGFKPVNDNYGHESGDKVIIQVANILSKECSDKDIVVRWGGDEYMVVAEVDDLDHAKTLCEKIRQAIANHAFDVGLANKFHLSSSLGFALYPFNHYAPHSITWDQVHLLADHALYRSKSAGRNTWTGIIQSDKDLPFSKLNSLVPNVDRAIDLEDVLVVTRYEHKYAIAK